MARLLLLVVAVVLFGCKVVVDPWKVELHHFKKRL